jgi:acyl-CoA synthetase (AMP-forming)/AMP-acid ligase II
LTGVRICDYYGIAEVGPVTFNDSTVPGSVGVPLDGVEVVLEPIESGGARVLVRTRSMARHFIDGHAPALAESLTADGFLRTRDLGSLDTDSRLRLVGRLGAVVNVAGRKIDPTEVADVLRTLSGVTDVVVRGESGADGELLAAYVESTTVDRAAVVEHCRAHLSVYKLPQRVTVLTAFPRTSAGKVNASALPGAQASPAGAQEEK